MSGTITITNHPLIQHKLAILRDKSTSSKDFATSLSKKKRLKPPLQPPR